MPSMSSRKAKASRRISRGQDRAARMSRMKPGVLTTEDARHYIQQIDENGFMRSEDATRWRSRGEAQNPRIPPLPLPFPLVILSEAEGEESPHSAFALAVAFPLVCHSAAQRRNPLFRLCPCPFPLSFRAKPKGKNPRIPPLPLPLPVLLFVIPQRSGGIRSSAFPLSLFPCHSDPERSRRGRLPAFRLCPCRCLSSCLSFRSAAEESALPPALALSPCHSDPERSRRGRIPAFRLCPCRCLSSCL